VTGDQRHRRGVVAVRDRNARVGRRGDPGGDARHDLEGHAHPGQGLGLLAAATEDERIAALEADSRATGACLLDEQGVDLLLGQGRRTRPLTDVAQLGLGAGTVERPSRDEPVVEDGVGRGDELERATGHEPGIPGSRADQVDLAGLGYVVCLTAMLDTVERHRRSLGPTRMTSFQTSGWRVVSSASIAEKIETARLSSAIDSSPRSAAWSSG
jgi:hypothetical protein